MLVIFFFVFFVNVINMIINRIFPFLISGCTLDEYRRKRRAKEHIAFQCEDHDAPPQPEAAPRPLAEEELLAEEDGLAPAAPAAVAVNADLPEEEGAVIVELGALPDPGPAPAGAVNADPPQEEGADEDASQDALPVTYTFLPTGSRKRSALVVASDGFTYSKRKGGNENTLKDGGTVFSCSYSHKRDNRCPAIVTQYRVADDDYYVRSPLLHNHDAPVSHACKRKTYAQLEGHSKDAIKEVVTSLPNPPVIDHVFRSIRRQRAMKRPRNPPSVTDPLDFEWLRKNCPDLKVLINRPGPDQGRTFAISTTFLLKECSQAPNWRVDGAFQVIMHYFVFILLVICLFF